MKPIRPWRGVEGVARGKASWGAALARNWWRLALFAILIGLIALLLTWSGALA